MSIQCTCGMTMPCGLHPIIPIPTDVLILALRQDLATLREQIAKEVEELDSDKIATEMYGEHAKDEAFCDGCTYAQNMEIIKSEIAERVRNPND